MAVSTLLRPYPVFGSYMDRGTHPTRLKPGTYSKLVGADGRFLGSMKRYPGNERIKDLTDLDASLGTVTFAKYAILRKGATSTVYRGWVVRHGAKITYFYYESGVGWGSYEFESSLADSSCKMDVAAHGRFLYVACEGESNYPKTVFWDTTGTPAWNTQTTGPGAFTGGSGNMPAPTVAGQNTGGVLSDGTYLVAYRFYSSARDVYSGLSEEVSIALSGGTTTQHIDVTMPTVGAGMGADPTGSTYDYDFLEIFRTISNDIAGQSILGGIYYREQLYDLSTYWNSGTPTAANIGLLLDAQLVVKPPYDPTGDIVEVPPNSGAISIYQGSTFMARAAADSGGGAGLKWSPLYKRAPESFRSDRVFRDSLKGGQIVQFQPAGDSLYGLTASVVYHIVRGPQGLIIRKIHYGRGLTSYGAAHAVGRDLFYMCPLGIAVVNGLSGEMHIATSADRTITEDWISSLSAVESCYDAQLGASFFLNKTQDEMIALWHTTRTSCILENARFAAICYGPEVISGGMDRAFFITPEGVVLSPDTTASGAGNWLDVDGTVDGTATGGTTTTVEDSAAAFDASAVDTYVTMLTGDNAGVSRQIASRTATELTTAAFDNAVASGDRYAVSPIPFKATFPPLPPIVKEKADFERRVVMGAAVHSAGHTNVSGHSNDKWKIGFFRNYSTTLDVEAWEDMDTNPSAQYTPLNVDGIVLEPYIELISSKVNFELTGLIVHSKMTGSSRVSD